MRNRVSEFVKDIATDKQLDFTLAKIYTEVDDSLVIEQINNNNIGQLSYDKTLTPTDVTNAETIVAQIGIEPFVDAVNAGADVILGGRSLDISPFSAIPIMEGYDRGITYHLAKLLECGTNTLKKADGRGDTIGQSGVVGVLGANYF
jgi:hypothetical protein